MTAAPNLEDSRVGRELVNSLCLQIYQLASSAGSQNQDEATTSSITENVAHSLPLPLVVMDAQQIIRFVNEAALRYIALPKEDVIGKDMYSLFDLSFANEHTYDNWLQDCRENRVTADQTWERVRLKLEDRKDLLQFDMAAHYDKENPSGTETIITMFDHTELYSQDDQAISFVAMAVHELRTPLTLLRGYIEVFEEEFDGKLDEELSGFMYKMQASAQSLAAFVNNILNVARVEENQMVLTLNEEKWEDVIKSAASDMQLRAQVHNKVINYNVAPGLPTVAVDHVSIYEVLNNLLDNAIKYSNEGQKIIVKSYINQDGWVETSIQDFGVGIPTSVMPNLFDKFYRNHRNSAQIGGTGLGLYLCRAIIAAHGGNIWVQSKEGIGSTFTFTLQPYHLLADELKNSNNTATTTRGAHGWIKNHSMYRR